MARRGPPCVEARLLPMPRAPRTKRTASTGRPRREAPRRREAPHVLIAALLLASGAVLTGMLAGAIAARAATVVVTTHDDSGPGSLRAAIASAADGATITIEGVSTHPGFAKGRMEHAIKIASAIVDRLPKDTCSPETTSDREGFLHQTNISGTLESATLQLIVRDRKSVV